MAELILIAGGEIAAAAATAGSLGAAVAAGAAGATAATASSFSWMTAASLAWTVGSTLMGLIFQAKGPTVSGPRIADLKIKTPSYPQ